MLVWQPSVHKVDERQVRCQALDRGSRWFFLGVFFRAVGFHWRFGVLHRGTALPSLDFISSVGERSSGGHQRVSHLLGNVRSSGVGGIRFASPHMVRAFLPHHEIGLRCVAFLACHAWSPNCSHLVDRANTPASSTSCRGDCALNERRCWFP